VDSGNRVLLLYGQRGRRARRTTAFLSGRAASPYFECGAAIARLKSCQAACQLE
jgi:hypothetical protein